MKQPLSRRSFIKVGGIAAVGTVALPHIVYAASSEELPQIALQLYTVRDEIAKDIPATLKRLTELGIQNVETAFWPKNITVKEAGKYLNDVGLKVCSSHIEIPLDDKSKDAMLETAQAFSCKRMIWHGWPEDKRYSSIEGTKELIVVYNEAGRFAKANGLEFGLHNHWWEYRNKVDGKFVYEVLLESVEPDIFFEVDTYWVKVAGHDPAEIVAKFGKRAPLLHIKDGPARWTDSLPADKPEPMTAVGKGTQNFPAIAKAANGNTEWMVVEMDVVASDVFAAIRDSYDYLTKNKLARGKS